MNRTTAGLLGVFGAFASLGVAVLMFLFPVFGVTMVALGVVWAGWCIGQEFLSD